MTENKQSPELLAFTPGPWSNKCNYIEANNDSIGLCFNINDSKLASLSPRMFEVLKKITKIPVCDKEFLNPIIEEAKELVSQMYK